MYTKTMFLAALAAGMSFSANASTIGFTSGSYSVDGLGDEKKTGFDKFSITGITSGSVTGVDNSNPQTATIGTMSFEAAWNCLICTPDPTGSATINFTFGSSTQQLILPFHLNLSPSPGMDTLNLLASEPIFFDLGNRQTLEVTTSAVSLTSGVGGGVGAADLTASFAIVGAGGAPTPNPEPATALLLLTGAAGIAMYRLKR